jgi:hypothetical protein
MKNIEITFEDHGQDFLTFTVTKTGKIVGVQPFQFSVWSQYKVNNMADLYVDGRVSLTKVEGEDRFSEMTLKYPIAKLKGYQRSLYQPSNK